MKRQIKIKQIDYKEIDFTKIYKVNHVDIEKEEIVLELELKE